MNPEHLSDDEFCRYADIDNPWIKSAVYRIERLNNDNEEYRLSLIRLVDVVKESTDEIMSQINITEIDK